MARKSKTYQTSLGFFEQVAEIEAIEKKIQAEDANWDVARRRNALTNHDSLPKKFFADLLKLFPDFQILSALPRGDRDAVRVPGTGSVRCCS
jgi:hypothetical protein